MARYEVRYVPSYRLYKYRVFSDYYTGGAGQMEDLPGIAARSFAKAKANALECIQERRKEPTILWSSDGANDFTPRNP